MTLKYFSLILGVFLVTFGNVYIVYSGIWQKVENLFNLLALTLLHLIRVNLGP